MTLTLALTLTLYPGGGLHGPQDGGRHTQGHPDRLDLRAQDLPARLQGRASLRAEARFSAPELQGSTEPAGWCGVQL